MKFLYPAADIAFRTRINTFLTLETVAGDFHGSIGWQFHCRRALSRAGAAAADAVFAFPMQSKERQDRKQRKDSSHWAQETAEKALLKEHADQDQHQENNAWNIRGKSEISRMQHGKNIPRAGSRKLSVYTF